MCWFKFFLTVASFNNISLSLSLVNKIHDLEHFFKWLKPRCVLASLLASLICSFNEFMSLSTSCTTGCPNKHGNSVTNSIYRLLKLFFDLVTMIPTEKAVILKIFVCYVYNLFVYVLTAYSCT